MRNNRRLMWVLGVCLIGVWGSIGYQVIGALYADDEPEMNSELAGNNSNISTEREGYRDDVRDPFQYFKPITTDAKSRPSHIPSQTLFVPPPYTLTGVVIDGSKKTALLEESDGSVSFVREGDSLGAIRILRIDAKQVTYSYMNQKKIWILAE